MGRYVHKPVFRNREAEALRASGQQEAAVKSCIEALDADPARIQALAIGWRPTSLEFRTEL